MTIHEYYPVKFVTTFKIGGPARYFAKAHCQDDVMQALYFVRQNRLPLFILGGGSNVLISDKGFPGLVLKFCLKGFELVKDDDEHVWLKAAAGEIWDNIVLRAVEAGWWGIENLSYIPGYAGAIAIQNVGAYGQEAQEVIESVEVCEIRTGKRMILTNPQCRFGYRTSIFNTTFQGKYLILSIVLRLEKHGTPTLMYRDLQEHFGHEKSPGLPEMRAAIIAIRRRKLPDPEQTGNAGSFFKNLLLNSAEFELLCQQIHTQFGSEALTRVEKLRSSPQAGKTGIKIPTALILDICGVKEFHVGGAAVYHSHPLILINATGHATAHDVLSLMRLIRQRVYRQTGLALMVEPTLFGFETLELQSYFSV